MGKVFESCAITLLSLVLPTDTYARNHHSKPVHAGSAESCLDQAAATQEGRVHIGDRVCVVSDSKRLSKKIDQKDMNGGSVFAGIYVVDVNGIPTQRVELDFYRENEDRPAEISVDEWKGRQQTRHSSFPVIAPMHETPEALLYQFKRVAEKSGALERLGR